MKRFCEASFILHLFFKSSSPLLLFLFWAGVSLGVTPIRIPHLSACPVGWVKLESSACLAFTLPHMTLTLPMTYWAINMAATRKGLGSDDIPVHIPLECLCVPLSKTRRSLFIDNIYGTLMQISWVCQVHNKFYVHEISNSLFLFFFFFLLGSTDSNLIS